MNLDDGKGKTPLLETGTKFTCSCLKCGTVFGHDNEYICRRLFDSHEKEIHSQSRPEPTEQQKRCPHAEPVFMPDMHAECPLCGLWATFPPEGVLLDAPLEMGWIATTAYITIDLEEKTP